MTVGALEPRKNHAFLLDVLAETARQGRRCSLDIVGEGSSHQELARRAAQLGLTPDVHFLGNRTDVRALLPGHRLYVHAAHHESFGISLIEAMSAGLPVLPLRWAAFPRCSTAAGRVPSGRSTTLSRRQGSFYVCWTITMPWPGRGTRPTPGS